MTKYYGNCYFPQSPQRTHKDHKVIREKLIVVFVAILVIMVKQDLENGSGFIWLLSEIGNRQL